MHATAKRLVLLITLTGWCGRGLAQPAEQRPAPGPAEKQGAEPAAAAPAPPPPPPPQPRPAAIQGKKLSGGPLEKVPRNTTEVFSVAPKKLIPPAPRSTNEQVVAVSPIRPLEPGNLPDAFRIVTTDLIGAATIYYSTIDENGKIEQKSVEFLVVDEISEALQSYLESTIKKTYPTVTVQVLVPNSQTAVLSGFVDRAELVDPIIQLVRGFLAARTGSPPDTIQVVNSVRVIGAQQVQLKVVIAEANRTKLRALGFDWAWQNLSNTGTISSVANSVGAATQGQLNAAFAQTPIPPVLNVLSSGANLPFVILRPGSFQFTGLLKALVNNQLGKILAEPILVTTSGQPAFFNSGGEVPVLIPQGFGTISIQYKPFGTNLSFVPTVLGDGRIRLEVRPEVSERSDANGVTFQGGVIPGFVTRVAETTVELENGQTFAIAGLMQQRVTATAIKTPFLGDLPLVGWTFQTKQYQQVEIELLIMVTPHLVSALDERPCKLPGRESRVPNDQEFYWGSKFEPPCFSDPYRDHYQKHFHHIPVPLPQAVQPYDNYGRPEWMTYPPGTEPAVTPVPATEPGQRRVETAPAPGTQPPAAAPAPPKQAAAPANAEVIDLDHLVPPPAGQPGEAKIVSVQREDIPVEEDNETQRDGWQNSDAK